MKTKSKNSKKAERKPVQYELIARLYTDGTPIDEIAKKTGRYAEGSLDPTHGLRAILSRMRSIGWTGKDGKTKKLTVARNGQKKASKKAVKQTKRAAKKSSPKPKKNGLPAVDGKTAAAGER